MQNRKVLTYQRIKTLLFLCLIVVAWSLFYGASKFTLKNLALPNFSISHDKLLAQVEMLISIGGILAYGIGGLLSKRFSKRSLLWAITFLAIVVFLTYGLFLTEYWAGFIIAGLAIGFLYGFFAVLRGILISIEIEKTHFSDTFVNGLVTLTYISTFILGAILSTFLFERIAASTIYVFAGILAVGLIIEEELDYSKEDHLKKDLKKNFKDLIEDIKYLWDHSIQLLFASSIIWAIYVAIGVKTIPYCQDVFQIPESTSSWTLFALALGAVIGNALTLSTKSRWTSFLHYLLYFSGVVFASIFLMKSFILVLILSLLIGVGMGGTTNLVDSYFLKYIGDHNKKEAGIAMLGIILNIVLALILLIGNYLSLQAWLALMGSILLIMGGITYFKYT